MTIQEIEQIVKKASVDRYAVKCKDGRTINVRLWRSGCGVAIMNKGAKNCGRVLQTWQCENWASLRRIEKRKVDYVRRMKKRASDALKMLNESGLWPEIRKSIEHFLSDDEIVRQVIEDIGKGGFYDACVRGRHRHWCTSYAIFEAFYGDRCWKSIRHHPWFVETEKYRIREAIKNGDAYTNKWKNGYDCSVEVRFDDNGVGRAWYSEEYVGCANGWYYLMFDATHAIFYDKD